MRTRSGFITNSSSTSFIITNISEEKKTLVDFVEENAHLLTDFVERYCYGNEAEKFNHEKMVEDAVQEGIVFEPGEALHCTFGDEDGTTIGHVYDYILRDGGSSKSFKWKFLEFNR